MHSPIKKYIQRNYPDGSITQWFENPQLYRRWGLEGHNGIDIVAPHGTDLLAVEDGWIVDVKYDPSGYGKHVRFISKRDINGKHREWTYGHLSKINVVVGAEVKAGQKVGEMGNTGFVISGATPFWQVNPFAGTHLHLGLRMVRLDEKGWSYPKSDIRIQVEDYDNGYKGSINPSIYFHNTTTKQEKMLTLISLLNQVVKLMQKLSTGNTQKTH